MIAYLHGTIFEKQPDKVIVDVHGVGYEVFIPISTYTSLPSKGAPVALYVYTYVREDSIQLYGFLSAEERAIFEKLITVNGVGPRVAISLLSGMRPNELAAAIQSGEAQRLTRIPGIGRKTAERIVLELREKIQLPSGQPVAAGQPPLSQVEQDVISALVNLGSKPEAAEQAVRRARSMLPDADFEQLFRKALDYVR